MPFINILIFFICNKKRARGFPSSKFKGSLKFPQIKANFIFNNNNIIIQTLLGPSLDKVISFYGSPFSLSTIYLIAIDLIKKLRSLHNLGYLHNDIKPQNICWGIVKNGKISRINEIFLIDYDLCTKYRFFKSKKENEFYKKYKRTIHYDNIQASKIHGNLKFMAKDVLNGKRPCRKTELESFLYLIIYLIDLELPWSNVKSKNYFEKRDKIISIHNKLNINKFLKNLPYELSYIFNNIKELAFQSKPNYDLYIKIFRDFLIQKKENKSIFCWIEKYENFIQNQMYSDGDLITTKHIYNNFI